MRQNRNITSRSSFIRVAIASLAIVAGSAIGAAAQQPATGGKAEHPPAGAKGEHPATGAAAEHPKKVFTTDDMARGIQSYVDTDSALKGGSFLVFDAVQSKVLSLKLAKIHLDKLAKVSDGLYFACCDFSASDGKTYDLDFWMKESGDKLAVSEIKVHKDSGVPRYNWVEKDGVWSTVSAK